MVDAAALADSRQNATQTVASDRATAAFAATVHANAHSFAKACGSLDLFAPPQSALWVSSWIEACRPDAVLVTVERNGRPVFGFGLEVERKGPVKVARVLGLSHANGNFFPTSGALPQADDHACVVAAIQAVRAARPDIHALMFERQLSSLRGRANPILTLPSQASPNVALSLDLSPGFEAVLDANSGARKRKRHRYQARKLEAIGTVRRFRPRSADEVARVCTAFFEMKAVKLRQMGIADVFEPEPVRAFFGKLFAGSAQSQEPQFVLDAIEVDGKIRAVTGSSLCGDRLICDFAGYAEGDTTGASPGDYLLFENIKDAAAAGFAVYDLGVGDEPYKRSWCEIETWQQDAFVALTAAGSALGFVESAKTRLKSAIKGNARLWSLVKTARGALRRKRD